jgi:predicted HicB family RNase H-like nuclease
MNYKGFISVEEFDEEINSFLGEIINTRDIITFQADSADGLRRAFEESVDEYLHFCIDIGKSPEIIS